ncbi:type II secretion system protein [Sapientia aquatica]|uniref:Type II secretion system protein n=2 Tax=Sapientia aquatica TaxID=1549640 RepID=A0A4R5W1A5_9BURK|nr:type II secretion system protein [Sapientia aquatica]
MRERSYPNLHGNSSDSNTDWQSNSGLFMKNIFTTSNNQGAQHGFTLVEISIVLVIIGTILFALLKSQAVISSAKAKNVVTIINDLRTATTYFKQRYSYLPGDLPAPANYITATPALIAGTGGTPGNGLIEGTVNGAGQAVAGSEVAQAPWQLFNAGLIGTINASTPTNYLNTNYGPVHIVTNAIANGLVPGFTALNPGAQHAIIFFNLPCDVANEVDSKMDDGSLTTGAGLGSAACTGSNTLPVYAIAL